ncbi:D-ribose pyranase [Ruania alba]|uniref:D-ribose pyranase n=1 Tax=Ruania alba TaxID=648782 RepID=A0A1H5DMB0_9MICO|nr:D-ribose pyranase [Ruania alba]SED80015.1 ribose transport protein RbsD [Ruania alba]
MRKSRTTIHPQLSRIISELGHTDELFVADAGLPIPPRAERVDLAYRQGQPPFLDVLDVILAEIVIEGAVMPAEVAEVSPQMLRAVQDRLDPHGIEVQLIPHVQYKQRSTGARAFVRTGEYTPYANVALIAGVDY